jgi:hypothetical protein
MSAQTLRVSAAAPVEAVEHVTYETLGEFQTSPDGTSRP